MAKAHGTGPDGVELDLIGRPLHLRPGPAPGLHFETESTMSKAPRDGIYTLGKGRFRMRAGQELPPGAVIEPTAAELETARLVAIAEQLEPAEAGKGPAPENKSKGKAPETKAKA